MTTYPILCDGPGPHDPKGGVLGASTSPPRGGMRCGSPSCAVTPDPAPPTDMERLAAVLVTKVDTLTEADVAKALGVHEERVAAASAELSAEVAIKAAPIKGVTR